MNVFLTLRFLGTFFLLSSSFPYLTSSNSTYDNHSIRNLSDRVLSTIPTSISQQFLAPHNRVRAKLGLRPLKWSKKLVKFASSWANQRKGDCKLIHSKSNYGENIFWGTGKDWTPGDAVKAWASEKRFYNYRMNKCLQNQDCWHYTQMVWKRSLKVGCARVICETGDTFITCNYDPHGNVVGQKPF